MVSRALIAILLGWVPAVSAQDWARVKVEQSPRHRQWVSVQHDGRALETFVVYPERPTRSAVVLVIHEIFGMTDWVQDVADQVAAAGYIAVAPDLLSGMGPHGGRSTDFPPGGAVEAVSHLDPAQITADLNAVADYALKLPAANGRLMVAGFCWWGGGAKLSVHHRAAGSGGGVRVLWSAPPKEAMAHIRAPIYGFYGGNDTRIDAIIPDTVAAMKALGKTYEPVTYAGAGHGFMRAGEAPDASEANRRARGEAWERWRSLLARGS